MATMIDFAEGPQAYASLDQDLLKLALDRLANPSKYGQWNETEAGDRVWNESSFNIPTIDGYTLEAYDDGLRLNRGGRWTDHYDQSGQWKDRTLGDSAWVQWRDGIVKPALMAAGAYFGAQGLEGAMGGGAAAGEAAAGAGTGGMSAETAAFLEANMGAGAPMAGMPGSAWYNAVTPYLGSGAGDLAYTAGNALNGVSSGLSSVGSGGSSALGSGASSLVGGAKDVMGATGLNMGGLLGAAAGALSSKDQTQTTNRDPWSAAQPFLKELLGQGSQLNAKYAQQPFSQAQQTAYGNMGSLLDAINSNAGGLLGAFSNSASGANQFVRGQPQRLQGGSMNMSGFAPGLLGYMGSR